MALPRATHALLLALMATVAASQSPAGAPSSTMMSMPPMATMATSPSPMAMAPPPPSATSPLTESPVASPPSPPTSPASSPMTPGMAMTPAMSMAPGMSSMSPAPSTSGGVGVVTCSVGFHLVPALLAGVVLLA